MCRCVCVGRVRGAAVFGEPLWADGSQQLPACFQSRWWRRARAGMRGTRLLLHLPRPQIEALFISISLSVLFPKVSRSSRNPSGSRRTFPTKPQIRSLISCKDVQALAADVTPATAERNRSCSTRFRWFSLLWYIS